MKTKEFTAEEIEACLEEMRRVGPTYGDLAFFVLTARAELDASRRWARAWKDLAESKDRALSYERSTQRTYYDVRSAHRRAEEELAECRAERDALQDKYQLLLLQMKSLGAAQMAETFEEQK